MSKPKSNSREQKESSHEKTNLPEEQENPSWYHYVVILGGVILIIWGISFLINTYNSSQEVEIVDTVESGEIYSYVHKVGNVTYTINLVQPLERLEKLNYIIEPQLFDILNTASFKFSFGEYRGTDNGQVTLAATKLRRYLSTVHYMNFDQEDFLSGSSPSCNNSTTVNRVITFEVNSSALVPGIYEEENGCIRMVSNEAIELPYIIDYFIVSILKEK